MRTLVEISCSTGVPLESLTRLDWQELATYVDVLTPKQRRH